MKEPIPLLKKRLRSEMRARLAALDPVQRREHSARLSRRLLELASFRDATHVLGYCPLPAEPDLLPALRCLREHGTVLCLPRWDPLRGEYLPAVAASEDSLVPGPYDIPEPPASAPLVPWAELDLIVVPGLAFDPMGRRLGRGRGFFDRLLARADHARRWGIAFDLQVVDVVPDEPHDIHMHVLVTPERTWAVAPAASP